ncbi:hypothetical protein Acr_21g0005090 [Actinidia rufa]|uniref:Uncharacterized protein n=1 Tax=Actinidia rufa TaxID=165716 RepID=A0A7J0GGG0_9ERIC|nr:hypothetical protein Acr_21g0005090 [Actinidia rufa]
MSATESAMMWRTTGSHPGAWTSLPRVWRVRAWNPLHLAHETRGFTSSTRGRACGLLPERAGAWLRVAAFPWRVRAHGSSPVRVTARGTSLGAWLRLISLADLQTAREGAFGIHFRRGLVLELRIDERNNLVQSKINFEHFLRHPSFDLGSESPPPRL